MSFFQNPLTDVWETADQYLSGNVREKLAIAATYAENHPEYAKCTGSYAGTAEGAGRIGD